MASSFLSDDRAGAGLITKPLAGARTPRGFGARQVPTRITLAAANPASHGKKKFETLISEKERKDPSPSPFVSSTPD